jgi:hypothetical protein
MHEKKERPITWAERLINLRIQLQYTKPEDIPKMAKRLGIEETEYMKIEEGVREPTKDEKEKYWKFVNSRHGRHKKLTQEQKREMNRTILERYTSPISERESSSSSTESVKNSDDFSDLHKK